LTCSVLSTLLIYFSLTRPPPPPPLFPYTTLFRSSRPASFCNLTHSRNISEKSSLRTPTKTPLPRVSEWALTTTSSRSAYASPRRSEEHTSELQSRFDLVCRLLLEKKNNKQTRRLV